MEFSGQEQRKSTARAASMFQLLGIYPKLCLNPRTALLNMNSPNPISSTIKKRAPHPRTSNTKQRWCSMQGSGYEMLDVGHGLQALAGYLQGCIKRSTVIAREHLGALWRETALPLHFTGGKESHTSGSARGQFSPGPLAVSRKNCVVKRQTNSGNPTARPHTAHKVTVSRPSHSQPLQT